MAFEKGAKQKLGIITYNGADLVSAANPTITITNINDDGTVISPATNSILYVDTGEGVLTLEDYETDSDIVIVTVSGDDIDTVKNVYYFEGTWVEEKANALVKNRSVVVR